MDKLLGRDSTKNASELDWIEQVLIAAHRIVVFNLTKELRHEIDSEQTALDSIFQTIAIFCNKDLEERTAKAAFRLCSLIAKRRAIDAIRCVCLPQQIINSWFLYLTHSTSAINYGTYRNLKAKA